MALSSFTGSPAYCVTAQCDQLDSVQTGQHMTTDSDVGDQQAGQAVRGSALFRPQPGLLLAVRYRPMPVAVGTSWYQSRFGLLFTEESFIECCSGRYEELPDPFQDLDNKVFDRLETPGPIDLEAHIQRKYGRTAKEQRQTWLTEDAKKVDEMREASQRSSLLERYLAVLAGETPLIVHGLEESEDRRLETLLAIRPYLPLRARPFLTFVTHVFDPGRVGNKAAFLGLGTGLPVSGQINSWAYTFDGARRTFDREPDSQKALKTAANFLDAQLKLPPEEYLQGSEDYLDGVPHESDVRRDKEQRIWQLGAYYRWSVMGLSNSSKDSADYLEEYCLQLASPSQKVRVVRDVLDRCTEERNITDLARTVRLIAARGVDLVGSPESIDLPAELSERVTPVISNGGLSLAQVVNLAVEVWKESAVRQDPWADLLISLLATSAAIQDQIGDLEPLDQLRAEGQVFGAESNIARFYGRVLEKTKVPSLKEKFVRDSLATFKSREGVSTLLLQMGEETLPWHQLFFKTLVNNPEEIGDFVMSSADNKDDLVSRPSMSEYAMCAVSVQNSLKIPSSFWQALLEKQMGGQLDQAELLDLLRLCLVNETQLLDWQPETLDALVRLIPENAAELAESLLELPPLFSAAVYEKAIDLLVEGSKTGKLPDVFPRMTESLNSVREWEPLKNSLDFIKDFALKVNRGDIEHYDGLIRSALDRLKSLETDHLLEESVADIADVLEGHFDRDAQWLRWFRSLTLHLDTGRFMDLTLAFSQLKNDDGVAEGTLLWLEKRMDTSGTASSDVLLEQWFSTLADDGELKHLDAILPPLIKALLEIQGNAGFPPASISLEVLMRKAWGAVLEVTILFDDEDGVHSAMSQDHLIQFVSQSDRKGALSKIAEYLHRQGNTGSKLEKGISTIIEKLQNPPSNRVAQTTNTFGSGYPLNGQKVYEQLRASAIGMFFLHQARAILNPDRTGLPLPVTDRVRRNANQAVRDAWSPNFNDFRSDIYRMIRGTGSSGGKKDSDTLHELFEWGLHFNG